MEALMEELKFLRTFHKQHLAESDINLDIGFLFASPLIFKELNSGPKENYSVLDPIIFGKEV